MQAEEEARMKSIVIVNNEKRIAESVRMHLELAGFRVRVYERGRKALAGLIEEPCDLVILDSYNPPLGGVALLRELRKHCATPVIFLTPHADDIAKELRGTQFDAADYIALPCSLQDMVARVKVVLEPGDPSRWTEAAK
jgi:DNA-binding response OmpR family regulator